MTLITCRWCRRAVAVAATGIRGRILCPPGTRCAHTRARGAREPSSSSQRDALVVRLANEGHQHAGIARMVNVTPTRVSQIIQERRN